MVSIQDLLRLNVLSGFHLAVENADLGRIVSNVVILEYESDTGIYDGFNEGDFVLTSLFFAKNDPAAVLPCFSELMKRDISGIAVKTVYYDTLPEEVLALARLKKIPVFLFERTYMEDIILGVNECLKSNQRYLFLEQKISELLDRRMTPEQVHETAIEIYPDFKPYVSTVYLELIPASDDARVFRLLNKLLYRKKHTQLGDDCFLLKYKKGILAFFHSNSSRRSQRINTQFLELLGPDSSDCRLGFCDGVYALDHLDVCIQKSVYAFRIARVNGKDIEYSGNLGLYSFILPLCENKTAQEYYHLLYKRIVDYDKSFHSELMETLVCYVEKEGEIAAVAEALHQHQNTVRYRLQRAKALLEVEGNFQLRVVMSIIVELNRLK